MLGVLDKFSVDYMAQEANVHANMLARQASGYDVRRGRFEIKRRLASCNILVMHGDNSKSVTKNVESYLKGGE
jgi:hypothetical protein